MNEKEARDGTTNTYGSKYMKDFTLTNIEQIFKRAQIIFACALIISLLSLGILLFGYFTVPRNNKLVAEADNSDLS